MPHQCICYSKKQTDTDRFNEDQVNCATCEMFNGVKCRDHEIIVWKHPQYIDVEQVDERW